MKILGVVPARGGSKGVPGKNIRSLYGKPLIYWTISEAKKSKHINRLIVSTDDEGIAEVARSCGAEVPFMRPKEISQDLSTDVECFLHTLDWFKENEGYEPDIFVRLPPTSPLRTTVDIDLGVETLMRYPEADSSRAICESPKHPYKMWKINEGSPYLEPFLDESFTDFEDSHNLPRQLFPKVYIHTGAVDAIRPQTIYEQKSTSGKKCAYFFMPSERTVNIDSILDFEFAEFLMKKRLEI